MPEFMSRFKDQVADFWKSLEKSQKTRIIVTSALIVVAITVAMVVLTRPTYITLISNASHKQVGEMTQILDSNSIWYRLEGGGTSIIINSKDNNRAQILLAQEGYPKEGMTFEDAVSLIGISTTESMKDKIMKQQKISDIATKIKMLDNIEHAEVNLAIPERTIFISSGQEQPRPTAYVMVKPRERLSTGQVEGIVMIVSRSVESLDPKDVTVVDNNGNILNSNFVDESITIVNTQEEMRVKRERELEKKVYEYFNVGQFDSFDTLRVVANVVLDFDKEREQVKSISNPHGMDDGAIISRETRQVDLENMAPGGAPGMETNPGTDYTVTYQMGENESSTYSERYNVENFGYDERLRELEKATGQLVPEDSSMAISLWYGKSVTTDSALTDEFMTQIRLAASTATGIPANNISINKLKMGAPEIMQPSTRDRVRELVSEFGFFAVLILLIIALMIFVIPVRRRQARELEFAGIGETADVNETMLPVDDSSQVEIPEIDVGEKSEIKKQIDKFVKQKPQAVAQLLRNWIAEDWDI